MNAVRVSDASLLVNAVRGLPVSAENVNPGSWLVQAAVHHRVVTPLYRACRKGDIEHGAAGLARLAADRRATALRISHWGVETSRWLTKAGIAHAIVKGPAVAAAYPDADREFVDLDVLVEPAAMHAAIDVLTRHGAEAIDGKSWPRDDGIAELGFGLASGVAIDLHADLIHKQDVRRDFDFPASMLLARASTTLVLGQEIPVLDPQDTLIYVALHAMISGGDRLSWLADLDALVRHGGIDWPTVVARARRAKLALVLGVMLQRAVIVLETPVPTDALRALLRRGKLWSRLLVTFERRRPTAANFGRNVRGQVLMRATRDSTATSLKTLARLVWTDVIVFAVTDDRHPWRTR